MKKQSGFRCVCVTLAFTLFALAVLTAVCFAADIVDPGYCGKGGDNKTLSWTLDSDSLLTISGAGERKEPG